MSRRVERKQEVCSASAQYGSLITEPNCLIRSETTRKPQCYTAPGQRPPSLTAGRVFSSYLGAGGRAKLPSGSTQCVPECGCSGEKDAGVAFRRKAWPRARPGGEGHWAQNRRRLFASSEHLESLWFLWELWEAGGGAEAVCVSDNCVVMAMSWKLTNSVCVCVCV